MKSFEAFEKHALEYDAWYDKYGPAYESELLALKQFLPKKLRKLRALEIGVGTGRFAGPLGIGYGVEPARAMAELAKKRGVEAVLGVAEALPFKGGSFDLVLIVTAIAFFKDPLQGLREAARALKPGGQIIIGMLDRDSPPGQYYESKREEGKFSSGARFLSAAELKAHLVKLGFENIKTCQTIFKIPEEIEEIETVKHGTGDGLLAVISAWKPAAEKCFH
ncbi:class I SAM-dependent methyltransferase [Methanosarcina sp. KYL-1]|uniref:class I SAM-dependent methyltransferase n=1 Tax=Methanosarcina sp. KYL-1 TaxID=2602068 RepID=UPI0021014DA4|nr:class I SAM-dependent methyltransferase [Methanosarcina sp. KYL-1]MCQ1536820.1 class I SAM-dependent methyltransferase [Methanosarcina sp. KYL-1]